MLRQFILFAFVATHLFAQTSAIRNMMNASADAWNRGDLPTFAAFYEDSPETTFMGKQVVRGGVKAILERYQKGYSNRAAMGTLTFSEIEVRPLASGVALVTGKYELARTPSAGGKAWGRYTLIVRQTGGAWKIIHDHSSSY